MSALVLKSPLVVAIVELGSFVVYLPACTQQRNCGQRSIEAPVLRRELQGSCADQGEAVDLDAKFGWQSQEMEWGTDLHL